jgi:glycerol-3-phosphate cytidylyltransferase
MNKIGFTCGSFDLLHAGHIEMFRECKSVCDYLIVGLQINPTVDRAFKNKPTQSISERHIQLNSCKYVDEIICYNTEAELLELLKTIPIDIRIIGSDYIDKSFTGKDLSNIKLYYNKRNHSLSSTNLKQRIKNE